MRYVVNFDTRIVIPVVVEAGSIEEAEDKAKRSFGHFPPTHHISTLGRVSEWGVESVKLDES